MTPDPAPGPTASALGWPRSAIQGSPEAVDLWHRHFGRGLRRVTLETAEARLDLIHTFALRRPALGSRFVFSPADHPFVAQPERRILPLGQLSAPISLEAGNLRGGLALAPGADAALAIRGLLVALSRRRGWGCLWLPVPASEAPLWRDAARHAGLPMILRPTGRVFHANLSARDGWAGRMETASRNDRKNEARALARAEEAGLQITAGPATGEGFAVLRQLADHAAKTGRLKDSAPVFVPYTPRQEAYLADAARLPGQSGVIVRIDGPDGPLAATYWLRRGDDLLAIVTFHTEEARVFSPGLLMMRRSFLWAAEHGIERLDFNATDPLYARYADRAEAFLDLLILPAGRIGRALYRFARSRSPGLDPDSDPALWGAP